ncbi:filamentous hemagglutinin N-terminal domain-containing protein [Burkholderia multivorans]|uniref:two-partner secretion domain-containing protein n=1 Tax=Burkholderia multivorans TaxID=87883 RepID=UPI00209F5FC8|nr:filamentous hemagglutinin N-terminal domain-containing protein [Burkholderia multivorans]
MLDWVTTATGETRRVAERGGGRSAADFALRVAAFGALVTAGANSIWANAQIVGAGPQAPAVVQTPNGLPQVNINKPSAAGVSLNTYSQFDVQKSGAILHNASTIVNTQQAGYINGNPNLSAGQAARIIVNQVNSTAASQIKANVEIAGGRADVVLRQGQDSGRIRHYEPVHQSGWDIRRESRGGSRRGKGRGEGPDSDAGTTRGGPVARRRTECQLGTERNLSAGAHGAVGGSGRQCDGWPRRVRAERDGGLSAGTRR